VLVTIALDPIPASAQGSAPVFSDAITFTALPNPRAVAAGDLNDDGEIDLAVAGGDCVLAEDPTAGPVVVLLNTGDWSPATDGFGSPISLDTRGCSVQGQEVIIANLNGDVYLDIAVTFAQGSSGDGVVVYLNDPNHPGEVFFKTDYVFYGATCVHGLVAKDFDGDGDNDLAVAGLNYSDPNDVGVVVRLENTGSGVFNVTYDTWTGVSGNAWDLVAGNLTPEEGNKELVTCNRDDNSITALKNNGTGTFSVFQHKSGPASGTEFTYLSIAAGNLGGDNLLELSCPYAEVEQCTQDGAGIYADVFRHDPNTGEFIHERPSGAGTGDQYYLGDDFICRGTEIGFANAGTYRDVLFAIDWTGSGEDVVAIQLGNGDGTLYSTVYSFSIEPPGGTSDDAENPHDVIMAPVNPDGLADIITANFGTGNISVLRNSYGIIEE